MLLSPRGPARSPGSLPTALPTSVNPKGRRAAHRRLRRQLAGLIREFYMLGAQSCALLLSGNVYGDVATRICKDRPTDRRRRRLSPIVADLDKLTAHPSELPSAIISNLLHHFKTPLTMQPSERFRRGLSRPFISFFICLRNVQDRPWRSRSTGIDVSVHGSCGAFTEYKMS